MRWRVAQGSDVSGQVIGHSLRWPVARTTVSLRFVRAACRSLIRRWQVGSMHPPKCRGGTPFVS